MAKGKRPGEVADKPLSFCLPGFRESLRRRFFTAGGLVALAALWFVAARGFVLHSPHRPEGGGDRIGTSLEMVAGLEVGLVVALTMSALRFVLSRLAWTVVLLLSIPLFLAAVVAVPALVDYPLFSIPPCTAACVFFWLRLGDRARLKQSHREVVEDALDRSHHASLSDAWKQIVDAWTYVGGAEEENKEAGGQRGEGPETSMAAPPVGDLFHQRMARRGYLTAGRYIWGSLYEALGPLLAHWKWMLLGIVVAAPFLGRFGESAVPALSLLYFRFAAQAIHLPVTSPLLTPAGRREKCQATAAAAVAAALLLFGGTMAAMGLAGLFGILVPAGAFWHDADGPMAWTTVLELLLLPWTLLPALLGLRLLREETPGIAWSPGLLPVVVLLGSFFLVPFGRSSWPDWLTPSLFVGISAFAWVFFLVTLQGTCRRGDLGR